MTFKDLKFKKQGHGGIGATAKFKDVTVSIQAGEFVYSTPREDNLDPSQYSSFEVAIWNNSEDGDFVTDKFLDTNDSVAGWTGKDDIDKLLQKLS
jgi:hypothetical protein